MHKFLFHRIHDLAQIQWVSEFAWFLSYPVTYFVIFFVLFWAMFYARRKMYSFSLIFLTGITAWFGANLLKVFLRVERPFVELGFSPRVAESGFSFPSEHATIMMAVALSVFAIHRHFGYFLIGLAILVGLSRVVLGVHYPIDIIAGMGLAYGIFWFYKKLFDKI